MCSTLVLKAQINNKTFYLKQEWNLHDGDLFRLQILCDDGNSWSGTFTEDSAKDYMNKLYQNKDDYYSNTKTCLTGEGSEFKLDLSINDDNDTAIFTWKKRFEGVFQKQGSLTLTKDYTLTKYMLVDFLVDENKALKTTITELNRQAEDMNADIVKYKSELEKFVNIKTSVEENLYGKFIQLLNTKKQRIRSLEEQLQKCDN